MNTAQLAIHSAVGGHLCNTKFKNIIILWVKLL